MRLLCLALVTIIVSICSSCSHAPEQKIILSESVTPTGCRIVGEIESIEDFSENLGPCSDNPCVATVTVKSIIERGMSFNSQLSKEDVIDLKFEFTLSPTDTLFKELNTALPGLEVGDKFSGDIEKVISIKVSGVESIDTYRIFLYEKIEG